MKCYINYVNFYNVGRMFLVYVFIFVRNKKKNNLINLRKKIEEWKKIYKCENKNLVLFFKFIRVFKCNLDNFLFKNYKDIIGIISIFIYLLVYVIYVGEIVRINLLEDSVC